MFFFLFHFHHSYLAAGYSSLILCSSISLSKVIKEIPCFSENLKQKEITLLLSVVNFYTMDQIYCKKFKSMGKRV